MSIISVLLLVTLTAVMPPVYALTWSTGTQLTSSPISEYSPAVTQTADGRIWVLWHMYVNGRGQIFYKIYDGTWSSETQLTSDLSSNISPAIVQASDGKIWVFWSSDRMGPSGNWEIYYRTSSNNGVSWSPDSRLTFDDNLDGRPSVMRAQDSRIWLVWYSNRNGNNDLFYSYYDGSWSSFGVQLTTDSSQDMDPSIIQTQDGKIWVFWSSFRTGSYELWYKTSTNNGVSWSDETELTFVSSEWDESPWAISAKNGQIWVTWQRDVGKTQSDYDIYYKTFDGVTWSSDTSLVSDRTADDLLPSIYQTANTTIWVAWSASVNEDDFDIYFKRTFADYDVAVKGVTSPSPWAYRGYSRKVQVKVKNEGLIAASFTVAAYYDTTLIGTQMVLNLASGAETTVDFMWNTAGVAYGHYLLSATADQVPGEEDLTDNSLGGDIVMLTIAGDVNGDRLVNLLDAGSISAHWYPGPPVGPLGYGVTNDINNDNKVDVLDSAIVSAHWGQSW